jgi:hypothetical protein
MTARAKSRVLSAAVLGIVIFVTMIAQHNSRYSNGKAAYLAAAAHKFDALYAKPEVLGAVVGGMFVAATFVGAYEVVALGIYMIMKRSKKDDNGGT